METLITVTEGPRFTLRAGETGYVFEVFDGRLPAHRYWGGREAAVSDLEPVAPGTAPYLTTGTRSGEDGALFAPDLLPREYPSWGTGELRAPAWVLRRSDGTRAGALEYRGYEIFRPDGAADGAADGPAGPAPAGLPWISKTPAETLRVDCEDPAGGVAVSLFYTVMPDLPVILRWVRFTNTGAAAMELEEVASASVDLPAGEQPRDLVTLDGAWGRERGIHRRLVTPGVQAVESRGGASGHQHAPFLAILNGETTEHRGDAWGVSLLYSGNHRHRVEVDQYGSVRLQAGIGPAGFGWHLEPGEVFDSPACVLSYSGAGLNGLRNGLHRFVRHALLPTAWRDRDRPILANTWEAYYFDVDERKVAELAGHAARVGAEVLVLDDGWFRGRHDDSSSLGDWTPDAGKFPRGLAPAAEAVHGAGLRFGIWVEPEMVSPDSDLYRAHPEWVLGIPGREPTRARRQLVLDLSNPAVVEHLIEVLCAVLDSAPIDYVKWDMNRNITEPGAAHLPPERQGEVLHRYMLGLYRVLETVTTRYPRVLFEGCAGGGGRFDYGMLAWTPQFWTSDQTDAIERLSIQRGSSVMFPPETMGAHVSAVPNHQVGRVTPAMTRAAVALCYNYGYELDLGAERPEDLEVYRWFSALYRRWRAVLRTGRMVWLLPAGCGASVIGASVIGAPSSGAPSSGVLTSEASTLAAWMVVDRNGESALVVDVQVSARANRSPRYLPLRGLDPAQTYLVAGRNSSGATWTWRGSGALLLERGVPVPEQPGDYQSTIWELTPDREGSQRE